MADTDTTRQRLEALLKEQLERKDLTAEDVLKLTIARRLSECSNDIFARALGGNPQLAPLNFWGQR